MSWDLKRRPGERENGRWNEHEFEYEYEYEYDQTQETFPGVLKCGGEEDTYPG